MRFLLFIICLFLGGFFFRIFYTKLKYGNKNKHFDKLKNYKSANTKKIAIYFLFASFFLLIFSFFDIKYGTKEINIKSKGIDIVFVLDVSKSMNALDFEDENRFYSRLDASKKMISSFVLSNPGNRYGLSIFAGEGFSVSPLTSNISVFLTTLAGIDSDNLSKQGTDIKKAIETSHTLFSKNNNSKLLVLLTDGGDEKSSGDFSLINAELTKNNIGFLALGIGNLKGSYIPNGLNLFGEKKYLTYLGKKVVTSLNEKNIKFISNLFGGDYYKIDNLNDISFLGKYIDKFDKYFITKKIRGQKKTLNRNLAIFSFILFIIYFLLLFLDKKLYLFIDKIGKK